MGIAVILETRVFELCNSMYSNLSESAQAMDISVSQVYRVREDKRHINQKFIVGAIKAFPGHKLDDLFYLASDSPTVTDNHDNRRLATCSLDRPVAKKKQVIVGTGSFILATEESVQPPVQSHQEQGSRKVGVR